MVEVEEVLMVVFVLSRRFVIGDDKGLLQVVEGSNIRGRYFCLHF